jgi:alanine racemase
MPQNGRVERSCFTLDVSAIRRNAEMLLRAAGGAELWAVVKADAYGHGAVDVAKAVSGAGASALCVATLPEALELRVALPDARIIVMGPVGDDELAEAGTARVELVAAAGSIPENVPVHLELDTGMGRWGLSELPSPARNVVGVMSHFAASEADPDFTRLQIDRFRDATQDLHGVSRHLANSAGTLRFPRRLSTQFGAESRSTASRRSARAPVTTASSRRSAGSRSSPS